MRKLFVIVLVTVIIGSVGLISYKNFSKNSKNVNSPTLVYNGESGKWENIQNIPRINREELDKSSNKDGFNNMSLLRGYFDHYDEKNGDIVIKSLLPFTMGSQFETVNLKAPVSKIIYCAPKITIVPKTGEEILTQSLTFPVKDGQVLNIIGEKVINFGKFIQEANTDTYLFVQLTQDFDKTKTNYIKKIITIGLCD
jgi:hypothetical protein